jgi:hypothetical protein
MTMLRGEIVDIENSVSRNRIATVHNQAITAREYPKFSGKVPAFFRTGLKENLEHSGRSYLFSKKN